MPIFVCPRSKVTEMIKRHNPSKVVSLLDPGSWFPELGPAYAEKHLRLEFHDVHVPVLTHIFPGPAHIDQFLPFISTWDPEGSLLIHCHAGIGRSPAAAFIAACFHNPQTDELDIALELRRASALARPNEQWIRVADDAMGRKGRMIAAITETGRNLRFPQVVEGQAFQLPSVFSASTKHRKP